MWWDLEMGPLGVDRSWGGRTENSALIRIIRKHHALSPVSITWGHRKKPRWVLSSESAFQSVSTLILDLSASKLWKRNICCLSQSTVFCYSRLSWLRYIWMLFEETVRQAIESWFSPEGFRNIVKKKKKKKRKKNQHWILNLTLNQCTKKC